MSNPNSGQFNSENDDSNTGSETSVAGSSKSPDSIGYLLMANEQARVRAAEAAKVRAESAKDDKEESDSEDSESTPVSSKRKSVGRSIRNLFKRRPAALPVTSETKAVPVESRETISVGETGIQDDDGEEHEPLQIDHDSEPLESTTQATEDEPTDASNEIPSEDPTESEPFVTDYEPTPTFPTRTASVPLSSTTPVRRSFTHYQNNAVPPAVLANPNAATANAAPNLPPPISPNIAPNVVQNRVNSRNGVVGPIIAFAAANFLSKRRDRKIQRNVEKLNKQQVEALAKQKSDQRTEGYMQQQRLANLEQKAEASVPGKAESQPVTNIVTKNEQSINQEQTFTAAPVKVGEVIAGTFLAKEYASEKPAAEFNATDFGRQESQPQPEPAKREVFTKSETKESIDAEVAAEKERLRAEYENLAQEQRARLSQLQEKKAEQAPAPASGEAETEKIVNESQFDRRHEVKDDSSAYTPPMFSSNQPTSSSSNSQISGSSTDDSSTSSSSQQATTSGKIAEPSAIDPSTDLYRQSIRDGALVGLAVVILGFIAYIIF